MQHHFWDMDHTLLDNDCDVSWKAFLVREGMVGREALEIAARFYRDYEEGHLDVEAFLDFQLKEFRGQTPEAMEALAERHFAALVASRVYPEARLRVGELRAAGHGVALLTATNRTIANPVARHLGLDPVLATELALQDGRFTGRIQGDYCLGEGKRVCLEAYCRAQGLDPSEVRFYGDSLSDLPALRWVGHPTAVNPSPGLCEVALHEGWPILTFRREV